MPFKKGESGNPTGRPSGAKNKTTQAIREKIDTFLTDNFEAIQHDFETLDIKDRVRFYIDLLPYGVPKLKQTDFRANITNDVIIVRPPTL